jgi:hypothetical protein
MRLKRVQYAFAKTAIIDDAPSLQSIIAAASGFSPRLALLPGAG